MSAANPSGRTRRQRVFHLLGQVTITAILFAVLAGAYLYFREADHGPEPHEVAESPAPIPVTAITVHGHDVPLEWRYLAQTEASQVVPIRARVSGFLIERAFEEGQHVKQGQTIYRIDPQPFEVALAQANAQLAAARARLRRTSQGLERAKSLVSERAGSMADLEEWQGEHEVAAAEVQQQQERIAQAKLDLSYTTIESPISGVIGESLQDVGSYITAGSGDALLTTVRQIDPMFVRFSASERDQLRWQRLVGEGEVNDIPVEQFTVQVILPDGREYPYTGRIEFVDVAIDPSTLTAVVRATVQNPEETLRPGQFVNVRVTGAHRTNAMLVPQSAVLQTPAGTQVYVVDEESRVQPRPVEPGPWHGDDWIIESGLKPGELVIINRLMQIRPGMLVAVRQPGSEPLEPAEPGAATEGRLE